MMNSLYVRRCVYVSWTAAILQCPSLIDRQYSVGALLERLPTCRGVGSISNMRAELLLDERHVLSETAFAELVVWRVPAPVRGSAHRFRYRLALVVKGECVLRYDNEAGKGDHRHAGKTERRYDFTTHDRLLADFWADVDRLETST